MEGDKKSDGVERMGRKVEQAFGIWGGRVLLVVGPGRCESESREGQNRERGTAESAEKKRE